MFVGALVGKLYALASPRRRPGALDPDACLFTGMATLGVAIVGGPLTMTFLVLEIWRPCGRGGVLAACIAASISVRATFGYSFSTWRLHLRGETIRSAEDVGWLRELTVGKLMDPDPVTAPATMTLQEFRQAHPLGGGPYVALEDSEGRFAGLVAVAEAHADPSPLTTPIAALAKFVEPTLSPKMAAKAALAVFEAAQSEILAVVDGGDGGLIGTLGEAHRRAVSRGSGHGARRG